VDENAMYLQLPSIAGSHLHPQPEDMPSGSDNVPPNMGYFLFPEIVCLIIAKHTLTIRQKRNYSCKRPWVCETLRVQHFLNIQLKDVGEVISHIHCPLFIPQTFLVLFSVRG
jgi:hypothetical protein